MTIRLKQEITVWDKCDYNVPNHIYITDGGTLVGYIPQGTYTAKYFHTPSKQWSRTRRKFKEITTKKQLALYQI